MHLSLLLTKLMYIQSWACCDGRLRLQGGRSESMTSVYSAAGGGRYGAVSVTGEVNFGLSYDLQQGVLNVLIREAKNLAAVDEKRNRSDPYVKVSANISLRTFKACIHNIIVGKKSLYVSHLISSAGTWSTTYARMILQFAFTSFEIQLKLSIKRHTYDEHFRSYNDNEFYRGYTFSLRKRMYLTLA